MNAQVTVIIPTLNEELSIQRTIAETRAAGECEIIVVDGGSRDGTLSRSTEADLVIESAPGRAVQQNAGAEVAHGEYLLFLHADCRVTPQFNQAIHCGLQATDVIAGCFQQSIDHPARKYRLVERGNAWRVRNLGWIYGDQGLFIRKNDFVQLGMFPEMPLMEDLYFSKLLKKNGKLVISPHRLIVSPRRWEKNGLIRQTLRNWSFIGMTHCGVSATTLAKWYGHVRVES